jgi:hypothetical protein
VVVHIESCMRQRRCVSQIREIVHRVYIANRTNSCRAK